MDMQQNFEEISLEDILPTARTEHERKARFVQMLCVNTEAGIDLTYSYRGTVEEGYPVRNYRVRGVAADVHVPSVTSLFLSAFPFENEAHDLFGVQVDGNAIDFHGNFYKLAADKPMTIMSPEQKAAREKAVKIAAAKAAREKAAAQTAVQVSAAGEGVRPDEVDWEAERARVEAKCAALPEDKAAKVRAAFEAKMAKAKQAGANKKGGQ